MNHNAWPTPPPTGPGNQPPIPHNGNLNPAPANMGMPDPNLAPQPPSASKLGELASKIAEKALTGVKYIAKDTKDSLRKPTWEATGLPEAKEEIKMAARGIGRVALGTTARVGERYAGKASDKVRQASQLGAAIHESHIDYKTLRKSGFSRRQSNRIVKRSSHEGVYISRTEPTKTRVDLKTGKLHPAGELVPLRYLGVTSNESKGITGIALDPEGLVQKRTSEPHTRELSEEKQLTVDANDLALNSLMKKLQLRQAVSQGLAQKSRQTVDNLRNKDETLIRKKRHNARLDIQGEEALRRSLTPRRRALRAVTRPGGLVEQRVRRGKPLVHGALTNPR